MLSVLGSQLISFKFMKLFETRFISWKSNSIFGMRTLSAGTSLPRRPIEILESDIEEKFVKGSGAGGQKINKTSSAVQLLHKPTGIRIETQRFRGLADNRREARKLLKLKLDELYNGDQSKTALKIAKKQKQKAKQRQRAKKKKGELDSQEDVDELDERKDDSANMDPPPTSPHGSQA